MSQTLKKSLFFFLEAKNKLKKITPSPWCNVLDLPLHFLVRSMWVWKTCQLSDISQEMAQAHCRRPQPTSLRAHRHTAACTHICPHLGGVGDTHHSCRKEDPQHSMSLHPLSKQSTEKKQRKEEAGRSSTTSWWALSIPSSSWEGLVSSTWGPPGGCVGPSGVPVGCSPSEPLVASKLEIGSRRGALLGADPRSVGWDGATAGAQQRNQVSCEVGAIALAAALLGLPRTPSPPSALLCCLLLVLLIPSLCSSPCFSVFLFFLSCEPDRRQLRDAVLCFISSWQWSEALIWAPLLHLVLDAHVPRRHLLVLGVLHLCQPPLGLVSASNTTHWAFVQVFVCLEKLFYPWRWHLLIRVHTLSCNTPCLCQ